MKEKMINRIEEMKQQSSMRFANRTYFGENMNEIDIYNIDEDKLLGLFEQMVRIHYAQR
jgi:hypothetical protein